jgi:hypothetical protein
VTISDVLEFVASDNSSDMAENAAFLTLFPIFATS